MGDNSEFLDIIIRAKDASKASKDVDKVSRSVKSLDKSAGDASKSSGGLSKFGSGLSSLSSKIPSLIVAVGALTVELGVAAAAAAAKLNSEMIASASLAEGYRVRLARLLGSVSEGNRLFDEMAKFASTVAFEYEEIMGSATALAGVIKGGVDEITKYMPLIADLAAASGLGIQETTSQFIRMWSAGAASADLFRERGILAMLGFQAGVSYSADETRKKLIQAWEDPLSKFRGAATDLSDTWQGILSMMSDWWNQFMLQISEAGRSGSLFNYMKAGLKKYSNY